MDDATTTGGAILSLTEAARALGLDNARQLRAAIDAGILPGPDESLASARALQGFSDEWMARNAATAHARRDDIRDAFREEYGHGPAPRRPRRRHVAKTRIALA